MANMWYSPEHGGFVTKVAGTDRVIPLGGQEDQSMQQAYHDDKNAFRNTIAYDANKDYSADYGLLFGAESDTSNSMYYGGPNADWRGAMYDRADQRRGGLMGTGWYENSTSNMDRANQTQMAKRNNLIESMLNQGYSHTQMNAMMAGERNILNEDPDNASGNWFNDNFQPSNSSNESTGSNDGMFGGNPRDPLTEEQMANLFRKDTNFVENYRQERAKAAERSSVGSMFKEYLG